MNGILIPNIVDNINGIDQSLSVLSYTFIKNRTIYITGEITDLSAMSIQSQLMYLDSKSKNDIILLINSPGGAISSGFAIYDCIKFGVSCDVITVASGMAASMAAFLLASGTPGKRFALPSSEIMIHQPFGGAQGQATDIAVMAKHIQATKIKLAKILAEECKQPKENLLHDMERDHWLDAFEAQEYGLIDHIGYPSFENAEVGLNEGLY